MKILLIGGTIYLGSQILSGGGAIRKLSNNLEYKVESIGLPSLRSGMLELPVNVRFNNKSNVSLTVENIQLQAFLVRRNGEQEYGGQALKPVLQLNPGVTTETIFTQINLSSLNPFKSFNAGSFIENFFRGQSKGFESIQNSIGDAGKQLLVNAYQQIIIRVEGRFLNAPFSHVDRIQTQNLIA
ncbi:MAG: hypothetical protein AAF363_15705 [Bacteroidota bacterium]